MIPFFMSKNINACAAELLSEIKNQLSHRAKALAEFIRRWREIEVI